jgi:hypothetical protein
VANQALTMGKQIDFKLYYERNPNEKKTDLHDVAARLTRLRHPVIRLYISLKRYISGTMR